MVKVVLFASGLLTSLLLSVASPKLLASIHMRPQSTTASMHIVNCSDTGFLQTTCNGTTQASQSEWTAFQNYSNTTQGSTGYHYVESTVSCDSSNNCGYVKFIYENN